MWVIPKNHELYRFVQGTADLKSVLSNCLEESPYSLMWRSKPTPLKTWLIRWKRGGWFQLLSGQILKPSMQKYFEEKLTSLLADIHVSHSAPPAKEKELKTRDTYGRISKGSLQIVSHNMYFSRMSKDILALGSVKSSAIWKAWVTELRLEYSRRLKLAQRIREKESLSWRTPATQDLGILIKRLDVKPGRRFYDKKTGRNAQYGLTQQVQIYGQQDQEKPNLNGKSHGRLWMTPRAGNQSSTQKTSGRAMDKVTSLDSQVPYIESKNWATPEARNSTGYQISNGKKVLRLGSQVNETWPTPSSGGVTGGATGLAGGSGNREKLYKLLPIDEAKKMGCGKLNPDWVEQLMGLPVGWTQLTGAKPGENRVDRLRLLGNGVVPQVAEKAFITLFNKLQKPEEIQMSF